MPLLMTTVVCRVNIHRHTLAAKLHLDTTKHRDIHHYSLKMQEEFDPVLKTSWIRPEEFVYRCSVGWWNRTMFLRGRTKHGEKVTLPKKRLNTKPYLMHHRLVMLCARKS